MSHTWMPRITVDLFTWFLFLFITIGDSTAADTSTTKALSPPNILLIMADDIGYECFGCYGSTEYQTPHIDRLAATGIRFTQAHSTPLCTPSRVNLLSGKSNVFNYQDFGVYPKGEPTFANYFSEQGYRTAVAGKWQLQLDKAGRGISPKEAGFDTSCLWNLPGGARERYWDPSFIRDGQLLELPSDAFGPDVMTDFLIDFINQPSDQPFLAYYPMILVHDPFVPTPQSDGGRRKDKLKRSYETQKRNYVDMVHHMDHCVGRLMEAISKTGNDRNTLIIFTADNGTNAALNSELEGNEIQGGKGYTHDYGTHVPLIVSFPGRVPENQRCEDLIAFSDFFPTLVEAADLPPRTITDGDGVSFWPQCCGRQGSPRSWIYGYYFPRPYAKVFDNKYSHYPVHYARDHRYKLYDNGDLYDTLVDVMEADTIPPQTDQENPEQAAARAKLSAAINQYPSLGQAIEHGKTSNLLKPGSHRRSNPLPSSKN